ncbi:DUF2586 domain-containing protein [Panacibacter sp. KCS-6]|uniref:DUF2586 domain-containing protein n=1 Tax=Limnovirga soli TaxID=2656915 RepID=A0A8J8JSW9_9BACT|nr:DUF2586 domain-containing protein [Limnovirga soli]
MALVFYSNNLPGNALPSGGFYENERIKLIANPDAAIAAGITPDSGLVIFRMMYYHIAEVFRVNPNAILYVAVYPEPVGELTFEELSLVRTFANGKIRKMGVWTKKAYVEGHLALLQAQYDAAFSVIAPFEIFYGPNFYNTAEEDLPDLSAATAPNVHILVAQDGGALGAALFADAEIYSIGIIGMTLGALSLAKVHENIGWVEKFNMAVDGGEMDVPALSNGVLINTLADNIIKNAGTLDSRRLMFIKKYPAVTGSYYNDTHGACVATSDFAYAEDNITIDKAIRGIYARVVPFTNGPVLLDKTTGQLPPEYINVLQLEASKSLEEMEKAGELSGYEVTIDPNQDVNSTSQIVINVSNSKIGVSRNLIINIGY